MRVWVSHHEYDRVNQTFTIVLSDKRHAVYCVPEIVYYAVIMELTPEQFLPNRRGAAIENLDEFVDEISYKKTGNRISERSHKQLTNESRTIDI